VWLMHFVYLYECETLKPVELILRKGGIMEGMNETGVQYMHIWKCHNKAPCTSIIY
jgi:hypothetical protein